MAEDFPELEEADDKALVLSDADARSIVERKGEVLITYDAASISAGVDPEIAAQLAYSFTGDDGKTVKGISVRGAEQAARIMSGHGEAIRVTCDKVEDTPEHALSSPRPDASS